MRRIPIPLRHGGRAGFAKGEALAWSSARRRVVLAALAAASLVAAPGVAADAPLVSLTVYGTAGTNGWYVSDVTLNWSFGGPIYSSTGCSKCWIWSLMTAVISSTRKAIVVPPVISYQLSVISSETDN